MDPAMSNPTGRLVLRGVTAFDLMSSCPVSLHENATLREALTFFVDRNLSGAAVIDDSGRPVGVLSQSDILIHDREKIESQAVTEEEYGTPLSRSWWERFHLERRDATPVRDLMTPAVFCVRFDMPSCHVVAQMRDLNVHRLFVTDGSGVLVGVVTAMDVVRRLEAEEETG
jgi:CBS domain-containing protein